MNKKKDMNLLRNEFMTYIGGQVKVQCYDHNIPFIVNCKTDDKCYQRLDGNDCFCNRKLYFRCPDMKCKSGLCRKCYDQAVGNDLVFIRPPTIGDDNGNIDEDVVSSNCDDSNTSSRCSEDSLEHEWVEDSEVVPSHEFEVEEIVNEQGILIPNENDDIEDFVVSGGNDEIPNENIDPEYFPTALTGD